MKGIIHVINRKVASGKIAHQQTVSNTVLLQGYDHLMRLLAGDDADQHFIDRMQFGSGTDSPSVLDTILQTPITPIDDVAVSYPTAQSVRFAGDLTSAQANGFSIGEVGLMTVEGTLFARGTISPQLKQVGYQFEVTWTLGY